MKGAFNFNLTSRISWMILLENIKNLEHECGVAEMEKAQRPDDRNLARAWRRKWIDVEEAKKIYQQADRYLTQQMIDVVGNRVRQGDPVVVAIGGSSSRVGILYGTLAEFKATGTATVQGMARTSGSGAARLSYIQNIWNIVRVVPPTQPAWDVVV